MLRVVWSLSGEEVATLPLDDVPDVGTLKKRLQAFHGAAPRFRQAILHNGCRMPDDSKLEATQVEMLTIGFAQTSRMQAEELIDAARRNDLHKVANFLQRPQDPNLPGKFDQRPLFWAAEKGHVSCLEMLLEARADINVTECIDRSTPLINAAAAGQIHTVRTLLENNADLHLADCCGRVRRTALAHACLSGHGQVALLLAEWGAASDLSVNIQALCCARSGGMQKTSEIVQLLQRKVRRRFGPFARRLMLARSWRYRYRLQNCSGRFWGLAQVS